MSHKNKISLVKQIQNQYDSQLAIGRSKYADQQLERKSGDNICKDFIYSWSTYDTYIKHANYFAQYCKEQHRCRTLEQCRPYAQEWLDTRQNLSAWTQKMEAAAIAKLYNSSTSEMGLHTAERLRSSITRSRSETAYDKHFSERKNAEFVDFCRSTGLRRRELQSLHGDRLRQQNGKYYIYVNAGSKGGRERLAPVIGTDQQIQAVVNRMTAAGEGKVWDRVPTAADIHSYRADYATAIYKAAERPESERDRFWDMKNQKWLSGTYETRKDIHLKLDRAAMLIASQALGHNRIEIIASNYLRL